MDAADLELFERSLRPATEAHTGVDLDAALDELGWREALDDDPRAAVSLLFALQGEACSTSSALGRVVLHALGLGADLEPAVVLPTIGRWQPPAVVDGERVDVHGLGSAAIATRETALVIAPGDGKELAVTVPASALEQRVVTGLDPDLGLVEVTGSGLAVGSSTALAAPGWSGALALARIALGHELVGASRAMLALAREHALERVQFDRPIASFQAVRHRLAETLVAIETAEAVLDAAWLDGSQVTASMAKATAGRSALTAARNCQQVLAGIGFTTEHPLHRYIRRVRVLDALLGSAHALTAELGRELLASRQLPPLLPL
jgi:hypothetical protein